TDATTEPLLIPRRGSRRLPRGLQIGLFTCLALGGILAVPGESFLSFVHRTEQRLAAFRSVDFGSWIRSAPDKAIDNVSRPADLTAATATVERPMPLPGETAPVATTPEPPAREAADAVSTKETVALELTAANDRLEMPTALALEAAAARSTGTPHATR